MRLKSRILMAAQNCQAALWDVKMKEELLVLCTVRCPVPGRMERSQPSQNSYCQSAALPLATCQGAGSGSSAGYSCSTNIINSPTCLVASSHPLPGAAWDQRPLDLVTHPSAWFQVKCRCFEPDVSGTVSHPEALNNLLTWGISGWDVGKQLTQRAQGFTLALLLTHCYRTG